MMTVRRVSFMLPCLMACLVGCRPETVHNEVGEPPREEVRQPPLDEKDREIEKGLKRLADWQSHFDLFHVKNSHFPNKISYAIAYECDEGRYKKYMGQFIDTAFGIPTDADRKSTRLNSSHPTTSRMPSSA